MVFHQTAHPCQLLPCSQDLWWFSDPDEQTETPGLMGYPLLRGLKIVLMAWLGFNPTGKPNSVLEGVGYSPQGQQEVLQTEHGKPEAMVGTESSDFKVSGIDWLFPDGSHDGYEGLYQHQHLGDNVLQWLLNRWVETVGGHDSPVSVPLFPTDAPPMNQNRNPS